MKLCQENSEVDCKEASKSDLEALAEELLKNKPDKERVRILMKRQGIPYVEGALHQINAVLMALDQTPRNERETSL